MRQRLLHLSRFAREGRSGRSARFALIGISVSLSALMYPALTSFPSLTLESVNAAASVTPATDPDARCASCHETIYRTYKQTHMARASGTAIDGLLPGGFVQRSAGIEYKVFERDGSAWMSFHRAANSAGGLLAGERQLAYFIGSGQHGRTFLYQQQGLWFELPVNYYARRGTWDMAPAYENSREMPGPLPVDPNCLHCHTTGTAAPEAVARNAYASAPFSQNGIGCRACHGDPGAHLASHGQAMITNPAKLDPERRDSACIQCHLEGDAVVYRPGRSLAQFVPGERLSDVALYFIRASQANGGARATSQYEALLQSACKRSAGTSLTCTTCHDPHAEPASAQRVEFYRAKCLSCHTQPTLATTHHPEQPDCVACHMPRRETTDISHEQVTDHNIEAVPTQLHLRSPGAAEDLVAVGETGPSNRDLGLAYAQMAQRGDRAAAARALTLLSKAEQAGADDEQLSLNLAFLYQVNGQSQKARAYYENALLVRPTEPAALSNLAVLEASEHHTAQAVMLLERLIAADPSQDKAGMNLATLQCQLGHTDEARRTVIRLEPFTPDSPAIRAFLRNGCDALLQPVLH